MKIRKKYRLAAEPTGYQTTAFRRMLPIVFRYPSVNAANSPALQAAGNRQSLSGCSPVLSDPFFKNVINSNIKLYIEIFILYFRFLLTKKENIY
jgi:hypothetical protein